jgi:hypothetical protein
MDTPDAGVVIIKDDAGKCTIKNGTCIPLTQDVAGCKFEAGACFYVQSTPVEIGDTNMALPPGFPPPKKAKPVHHEVPVVSKEEAPSEEKPVAAAPVLPELPALPKTTATVGQPALPAIPGLPANLPSSPLAVAALAIGALTTGAAWKFWQNRAKLKSAEKMKKMELEKSSSQNDEQKKKCEGTTLAFEKFKSETDAKLNEIISKLGPVIESLEPIDQRLVALEKAVKKSKKVVEEDDEEVEVVKKDAKKTAKVSKVEPEKAPPKKPGRKAKGA